MNTTRLNLGLGIGLAALIGAAGLATAQDQRGPDQRTVKADTNADGQVSQAEFVQTATTRLTAMDANGDGSVTIDERQAQRESRRAEASTRRFAALDGNGDGAISRAEFDARTEARKDRAGKGEGRRHMGRRHAGRGPGAAARSDATAGRNTGPVVIAEAQTRIAERFTRMDRDSDGFLTQADRQATREARGERRQNRRGAAGRNRAPVTGDTAPSGLQ